MPDVRAMEWIPDRIPVQAPGVADVDRMIPVADGWRAYPMPMATGYGSLGQPCRGAGSGRTQSGQNFVVAGTVDELWLARPSAFADVSKGGGYGLSASDRWDFTLYGNRIIAVAAGEAPQSYDIGVSALFADLSADASFARCIANFREFIVLGDIVGRGVNAAAIGTQEGAIHWSGVGAPTSWPQIGSAAAVNAQSDFQPLSGAGGAVMDIVPVGEFAIILRERQTIRMDYVGGVNTFEFRILDESRGALLRNCAVSVGGRVYFLSSEGFMMCDGARLYPIGHEKVDRTILSQLGRTSVALASMSAAHVARDRMVQWSLSLGSTDASTLLGYQYELDRWTKASFPAEAILTVFPGGGSLDAPPLATLDMDDTDPAELGAVDMDTLVSSTELVPALMLTGGNLYTLDGDPLFGSMTMGDYEAPDGLRHLLLSMRAVGKGESPGPVGFGMTARLSTRDNSGDPVEFPYPSPPGKGAVLDSNSYLKFRAVGRYFQLRLFFAGSVTLFEGVDPILVKQGTR